MFPIDSQQRRLQEDDKQAGQEMQDSFSHMFLPSRHSNTITKFKGEVETCHIEWLDKTHVFGTLTFIILIIMIEFICT